jgi:hypothetical protein
MYRLFRYLFFGAFRFRRSRWQSGLLPGSIALASLLVSGPLLADTPAFDLEGPKVEVRVMRDGKTRPIAEVPNLQAGDRLWIHPDLPESQSVHYLMAVVFLRGSTNPPPDSWFTRVETWNKTVREEGFTVFVPAEAEEALILLAPDTSGALPALRRSVTGKPGSFVRAAQDLQQASLDRARLEKYLEMVRQLSAAEPEQVKSATTLLARSLSIRLDQQCFDKPTAQQVPCLTQNTDQLVLDDGHGDSMVAAITSGASADLVTQVSATPMARSGYYSPYIGTVVDVVRILGAARTAQFQYIPALSLPQKDDLHLRLNNPPSFRSPRSVLVIALPLVRPSPPPMPRAINPSEIFCASQTEIVLPVEGSPVTFATELAHDFVLHVETKPGKSVDLPAKPDPAKGGFVVDTEAMRGASVDGEVSGVLRGIWGFRVFDGPRYRLHTAHPDDWIVDSRDASALIVGRKDTLHLRSGDTCCVREVSLQDEKGAKIQADWNIARSGELEVKAALQDASPGSVRVFVHKYGLAAPDIIPVHTYAEAARLDSFRIHAGDFEGRLRGTRLDQVTQVVINGARFHPSSLARENQTDELRLLTEDASIKSLRERETTTAQVELKDGRTLDQKAIIDAPRPQIALLTKSIQSETSTSASVVRLGSADELPQDSRLNFSLRTLAPETFPTTEKIEVATIDESFHVLLSFTDGNLALQDSRTVFAVLDPMKLLGPSAFGPLKLRAVSSDGAAGDWQPLVNLVRIPTLRAIRCTTGEDQLCTLTGDKLYLLDSVSADPDFATSVNVPEGFLEATLLVPIPKGSTLYLKLRDDPSVVDSTTLPLVTAKP